MNQEQVAEVLAGHQDWAYVKNLGYYRSKYECQCGADFWAGDHEEDPSFRASFSAHQAAMLAPLFAATQAEALREAADHVAEIDGRPDDAARDWLRARADNLTT